MKLSKGPSNAIFLVKRSVATHFVLNPKVKPTRLLRFCGCVVVFNDFMLPVGHTKGSCDFCPWLMFTVFVKDFHCGCEDFYPLMFLSRVCSKVPSSFLSCQFECSWCGYDASESSVNHTIERSMSHGFIIIFQLWFSVCVWSCDVCRFDVKLGFCMILLHACLHNVCVFILLFVCGRRLQADIIEFCWLIGW